LKPCELREYTMARVGGDLSARRIRR